MIRGAEKPSSKTPERVAAGVHQKAIRRRLQFPLCDLCDLCAMLSPMDVVLAQQPWCSPTMSLKDLTKFLLGSSTKKRFTKNLGKKIIQVKVNLGDDTDVVPGFTVHRYHCFDPELEVLTGPDNSGINGAGG
jgi:hypothetical protein